MIKPTLSAIALLALASCTYFDAAFQPEPQPITASAAVSLMPLANVDEPPREQVQSATVESDLHVNLPTKSETSRANLFRLVDSLTRAYNAFDLTPPMPQLRIVGNNHAVMRASELAKAVITEEGRELIYVLRAHLAAASQDELDATIIHEIAHLVTWRRHGLAVMEHGREFMDVCRDVASRDACAAYKGPKTGSLLR